MKTEKFVEDPETEKEAPTRMKWNRSLDFLLSLIGYGVGIGNIWRFPYLCAKNGGAVFLIPYAVFMITLALPLTFLELSLGQYSGKSTYDVWDLCPAFRGLGAAATVFSTINSMYFNMILAWILYYLVHSFMSPLPWTTCDNWWNTDTCIVKTVKEVALNSSINGTDQTFTYGLNQTYGINETGYLINENIFSVVNSTNISVKHFTASEEFWNHNVLRISAGLGDFGTMQWHLVVAMAVGWLMIFGCIVKGVKTVGKVVYVTATLPYVFITIILVRAVTLPGAIDGIKFYIIPDISKLANVQVWIQALMQIFFSMGIGWGGFTTMASYNKFNNNILRDTVIYCCIGEGTSFYAGFVVFSVLGFMSHKTGSLVEDIVNTGPGLAFITYPEALSQLPLPQLWAVLFFLMLLFVSIDSMFVSVEVVITTLTDLIPNLTSKTRLMVTASTCFLMSLFTLVYTTQNGIYIFQLVDWYMAALTLFSITILESFVVGWLYGADRYLDDLEMMLGKRPPVIFKYLWRFLNPILLTVVLIFTLVKYQPPTYGDYVYPNYAPALGWIIALASCLPIPIWLVKDIINRKGPLKRRIKTAFEPNKNWGPAKDYKLTYDTSETTL
ncbi:sodium- and chloride-dependent GABA transporter 1 isoform X1 [Patella vulgata]|uniref:sodium- and chloride-dependent GABA transporter 1 isoform X1 n=1 Tax=Patella vulgata TaxID=6465 RepID=UPI00217FAF8F|nr:sodium- and chloride-dependent GABA transporter 1 isoform X1 [Patella vulgata]XP_055957285.1 sodium- and chloride-dependent GABA transporter 1 isoform X1 [Patella vulgata]